LASEAQIEAEDQRIEEVFRKIEPAFALGVVLEIAIPITGLSQVNRIVGQVQGG